MVVQTAGNCLRLLLDDTGGTGRLWMRMAVWYFVYCAIGLYIMYQCQMTDNFLPHVEIIAATIWLGCLLWAVNVTSVVWMGEMLRRQK